MHGETSRGGRGASLPSRRALLTAVPYAAGLALVSGCGVRLDLPQPAPPVPTRRRVPDEEFLIGFVRDLGEILAEGAGVMAAGHGGGVLPTLQKLYEAQRRVLVGRLTNDGVPRDEINAPTPASTGQTDPSGSSDPATSPPAPSASPRASSTSTTGPGATSDATPASSASSPPTSTRQLAVRLADRNAPFWNGLAAATAPTRELLFSATMTRLAGAVLLGHDLPFEATAHTSSTDRAELVEQSAQLVYGFEVVAAQSAPDRRKLARATLEILHTLARDLGGQPAASAWSLPFPVTRPADAKRLATHLLSAGMGAAMTMADGAPSAASLRGAATWGARVEVLGPDWSLPLVPFPATT